MKGKNIDVAVRCTYLHQTFVIYMLNGSVQASGSLHVCVCVCVVLAIRTDCVCIGIRETGNEKAENSIFKASRTLKIKTAKEIELCAMDGSNAFEWTVWNQFCSFECVVCTLHCCWIVGSLDRWMLVDSFCFFFPSTIYNFVRRLSSQFQPIPTHSNTTCVFTHNEIRIHFYGLKVKQSEKHMMGAHHCALYTVSETRESFVRLFAYSERCLNSTCSADANV